MAKDILSCRYKTHHRTFVLGIRPWNEGFY